MASKAEDKTNLFNEAWKGLWFGNPVWVGLWLTFIPLFAGAVWFLAEPLISGKEVDPPPAISVNYGFTQEQFDKQLSGIIRHKDEHIKDLRQQIADLRLSSNGGDDSKALAAFAEALNLAEAGRADAEAKRAGLENAFKAKVAELDRLKAELTALQKDAPGIDSKRLKFSRAALAENRTEEADALLADLQNSNSDTAAIARQARVSYERGRLAEDRLDYAAAKDHFIRSAQLMPENADYLFEAQSLANKAGNYALGLHYAQDMLALAKRDGEDSLAYARAANEAASNLNAQGRYAEAEPLYRKGLEIWERVLGTDHPSTATSYNNVATNLMNQERLEEAEPYLRKAVEIIERLLGPEHSTGQRLRANLGVLLERLGKME